MARTLARVSTSNRDRIDIIASILDAANGGATRRRILLISGLSNSQFKRYLTLLIRDGYIRIEIRNENKRRFYVTTGKGLALLHAYGRVIELFQYEGLHQIAADLL
jgi:predicted transcriptional regulator